MENDVSKREQTKIANWTVADVHERVGDRATGYETESKHAGVKMADPVRRDVAYQAALAFETAALLQAQSLMGLATPDEARTIASRIGHYRRLMQDLGLLAGKEAKKGFENEL